MMEDTHNLAHDEMEARLLDTLASLNQISGTINNLAPGDDSSKNGSLQLIAESAIRVVPGSSAVIYTYDEARQVFELESRVHAAPARSDNWMPPQQGNDKPRPEGIGRRTILLGRRVLSYEEPDLEVHPYHVALGVKAVCCSPLIVAGQTVGALYIYLHEERQFTRLELLMLDNFVKQAAMAIYHSHRLHALRLDLERKEEEIGQLRRASMLISSRLRLTDTLEAILQLALEFTQARYGIIRLLDKSGRSLVTSAIAGENLDRPLIEALPLNANTVMGHVARSRQPVLIPDLSVPPWSQIYYPLDARLKMRSELAVPLINASGRLEGVLNVESPLPGAFNENDRHMLQSLATYAVTAIQEVRLLDALQEAAQRLLSQSPQQVLEHLAQTACDLLNTPCSLIWLNDQDQLLLQASFGAYQHPASLPLNTSLAGEAVLQRQAVMAERQRLDPPFHYPDFNYTEHWMHALVMPLIVGEQTQPVGAISVYSADPSPGRFTESDWDAKVLAFLAHYAALAIQNQGRIEALRAAEEQRLVAETFAAVGDIASNLLHHLNNKVGLIPVRVQNIEDKYQPVLDANPYLQVNLTEIERCATEAMQAVRDNLSYLRPIRLEPVRVDERFQMAVKNAHLPASIQVHINGLEQLPAVYAGASSLTFVFSNLLENAAHALNGQGIITIQGKNLPHGVEISVHDNGPGIQPQMHERIFDLNFSGAGSTRPGKLGFGLWWVKTLVTRLGGTVTVESDGQHGTTFRICLPRAQ